MARTDDELAVGTLAGFAANLAGEPDAAAMLAVLLAARGGYSAALEALAEPRARLVEALQHIDRERLIAAPDCGLGLLGRELAMTKLRNMCEAAHSL